MLVVSAMALMTPVHPATEQLTIMMTPHPKLLNSMLFIHIRMVPNGMPQYMDISFITSVGSSSRGSWVLSPICNLPLSQMCSRSDGMMKILEVLNPLLVFSEEAVIAILLLPLLLYATPGIFRI